jgi:ribosome recycling factor
MIQDVQKAIEEKMQKTISVLKEDLHSVRAGRANPQLLDRVVVEYYGSPTPLKSLATISAPEPRLLTIQPYDASAIREIEKAIQIADLGVNPTNDGKMIRIAIPMLTEERRKDLIKVVKRNGEESKVAIRNERREANERFKKMHKNVEITEDDLKSAEGDVQKMTDKYIKMIDEILLQKEKEIMEV